MTINIKKAQSELKSGKLLIDCENDTLDYVKKPIGRALYEGGKAHRNDRIKCPVCGKIFTRWNRVHHNKTQYHQTYLKVETKFRKYLLDD
jgi:hypothetical protein